MATHPRLLILRKIFSRLVFSLQYDSSCALKIIAFWMWLEANAINDMFESINLCDDSQFWTVSNSARSFVEVIQLEPNGSLNRSIPYSPFQQEIVEAVAFNINNFCYKILGDLLGQAELKNLVHQIAPASHMKEQLHQKKDLIAKMIQASLQIHKDHGEGTSSQSRSRGRQILETILEGIPMYESTNSLVESLENMGITDKEKHPNQHTGIVDDERTMLLTFPASCTLTEDELYDFFMRHYGDVEGISLEQPAEPSPPLYALVNFVSQETLMRVLGGNKKVKLIISGKQVWAQKYVPKCKNKV